VKKNAAQQAHVFLRKEAAAQRQLDAAIRMTFANEDQLAIHTVAAAAYGILRGLKQNQGRSELADRLGLGIFVVARDLALGKTDQMPPALAQSAVFAKLITDTVAAIQSGEVSHENDVIGKLRLINETGHWNKFNKAANFLKHADRDPRDTLPLDEMNNETLLFSGITAYLDLMGKPTPEMVVYAAFQGCEIEDLSPELRAASKQAPAKRRRTCLKLLRKLKTRSDFALS
jgi:hypothetical protein